MPRSATPTPAEPDTTAPTPPSTETLVYNSFTTGKRVEVEAIDGKAEVESQQDADRLNAAVDHVTFTVRTDQEK